MTNSTPCQEHSKAKGIDGGRRRVAEFELVHRRGVDDAPEPGTAPHLK
jgi:hypothetical protein